MQFWKLRDRLHCQPVWVYFSFCRGVSHGNDYAEIIMMHNCDAYTIIDIPYYIIWRVPTLYVYCILSAGNDSDLVSWPTSV